MPIFLFWDFVTGNVLNSALHFQEKMPTTEHSRAAQCIACAYLVLDVIVGGLLDQLPHLLHEDLGGYLIVDQHAAVLHTGLHNLAVPVSMRD